MLYKLGFSNEKFDKLEPVAFKDFSSFGNLEKDLEDLIAMSILDILFEEARLIPIFQERQLQAEADIYAIDEKGDLTIFELKRSSAGVSAVHQALRYAQEAGQWNSSIIQNKYRQYSGSTSDFLQVHQEAFDLPEPLEAKEINKQQHLIIIGSASDDQLINAVDYWKKQGLSINFLPYRIYEIGSEKYFEFFALPFDKHRNPRERKGILFDTNKSFEEESIWFMMANKCVAAFGEAKKNIYYINTDDIIFFSHKGAGLIAAAKVKKGAIKTPNNQTPYKIQIPNEQTLFRDVEFLTPFPQKGEPIKAMTFSKVSKVTGKSFFWAKTIKVPYLSKDEAEKLVVELKTFLEKRKI